MLYNRKIKPTLVDQNIIGEYMKEKVISQMKTSGVAQQSELQKLLTKIFYNIVNFIYHYFFIITIFIGIGYYLYKRYVWYQELKTKTQTQKPDKIKKYFDDIMDGVPTQVPSQVPTQVPLASHGFASKQATQQIQLPVYIAPNKKMDKVLSSNNGYLTHLRQTFDVPKAPTSSMGRIGASSKTVRFAPASIQTFDAYGRNNINPKTGETLVSPQVSFDNQIQAYDNNNGYSMF